MMIWNLLSNTKYIFINIYIVSECIYFIVIILFMTME